MGKAVKWYQKKPLNSKWLFSAIDRVLTEETSFLINSTEKQLQDGKSDKVVIPIDFEPAEKRYDADLKLWKIVIPAE